MIAKLIVTSGLVLALSGCVVAVGGKNDNDTVGDSSWEKTQRHNQQQVNQLTLDLSAEHIRSLMGAPDFSETFTKEGETIQVLFYRTHHMKSDGKTTKDECTPLIFKQDKLVGWGDKAYQYL
ncbi:DUF3192 domain-containing protein [Rheinheimera sp. WS51]|uniref:DUF3192 domain-containing protein n=1 Tax=Rheinheimera sp. WS51 TaxID=3425886 RepID=UPI003D907BC9